MKAKNFLLGLISISLLEGCGVRGDPQPPLVGAEIGHGQPSFKRAGSESDFANIPTPESAAKNSPEATPSPTPASSSE